ncbi:MAG: hypothetical protein ACTHPS_02805 [Streptosporangiaceae bacterium]
MTKESSAEPTDPFNPAALRITGDMEIATEKVLTAVPVRKPKRDEFFRVHPGDDYTMDALVVERDDDLDREIYIVTPACADAVGEVARKVRLFTCISRRGSVVFLWPAKLPVEANSGRRYSETALKIAHDAKTLWVRMWGDRNLGGYRAIRASGHFEEPKWPDKTFRELLRIAFESRIIDRSDHPFIRELNGDL